MTPPQYQLFQAILAHPSDWRRLALGTAALLALYLVMLIAVLTVSERVVHPPKKVRGNLIVTLLDVPQLAKMPELGRAGGSSAASPGGTEGKGRVAKIADPRPARPAPTVKSKVEVEPKSSPHEKMPEARAGAEQQQVAPVSSTVDTANTASSAPANPISSTSPVGSREGAMAGSAFGTGGAGKGEGAGKGGVERGDGAGARAGIVSGNTQVLSFIDGMTRPKLISKIDPEYTREARDANVEGVILAKCVITTTGMLLRCRIVKGIPLMDEAVLTALSQWRYSPVLYQGKAVAVEYLVSVRLVSP
jgi:TonB family protein